MQSDELTSVCRLCRIDMMGCDVDPISLTEVYCKMATPSFQAAFPVPPCRPVYYCEYRAALNVRKNSPYGRGRHFPLPELCPGKVRSNAPLHKGSLCFLGAVKAVPFDFQCHWDEKVEVCEASETVAEGKS